MKILNINESEIGVDILFEPEDKINTHVRRQQKFEETIEYVLSHSG